MTSLFIYALLMTALAVLVTMQLAYQGKWRKSTASCLAMKLPLKENIPQKPRTLLNQGQKK